MIRGILTLFTFVSTILFPWPFTVTLALISSFTEPFVPLAVGVFADTLYYAPQAYALPLFTLFGAVLTTVALLLRSQLRPNLVRDI